MTMERQAWVSHNENQLIPYHAIRELGQGAALVLAPHPDDEVFGCAGAILRHRAAGDQVTVVILTDGAGLQPEGPERNAQIAQRRQESLAAAAVLGYGEPVFWDYRDRELVYAEPLIQRLIVLMETAGIRWLYAPSPYELHPDHRHLGFAALEAARRTGQVSLAFYEIGAPLPPNRLLDITDLLDCKRKAIACFDSQLALQAYDRHVEALNRYRTYTLAREVEAAEAYWVVEAEELTEKLPFVYALIAAHWNSAATQPPLPIGPLVSVIVRTLGRCELVTALHSIAAQTYPAIEVVVVDAAGSGLPGFDIEHYRFPLRISSAGKALQRAAAANWGLKAVQGDFLIFLDDDDWFEPDHIAGLVECLQQATDAVAAYAGVRCVQCNAEARWETVQIYNEPFDEIRLRLENYIPIHALLFRNTVLEGAAPCRFDERFDWYEDWDFWLQLLAHGRFQHRARLSASYRIHAGGGLGIVADERQSLAAFQKVVGKWRLRWSDRQIMDMIARARHLDRLLKTTEERRAASVLEADELRLAIARYSQSLEKVEGERIALAEQGERLLGELKTSHCQVEHLQAELDAHRLEIRDWKSRHEWVLSSRSWRLTQPLRDSARWLRNSRDRAVTALARGLWRLGMAGYRGPLGYVLSRLPFSWKQAARLWLRRGMTAPVAKTSSAGRSLTENPLVSIIIPIYNHADYLEKCLLSALNQSYGEIEVIAVDDASPDPRVRAILDRLAAHPRLRRYTHTVNLGIAKTQNQALIESRGDIIGFLDCDDYLAPEAVAVCLSAWREGIVYAHSGRINIDGDDREVNRISFEHLPRQDYFAENLERMYATHFKLIARKAIARVGLFDPRFDVAQDYDLLLRIAFHYPSSAFVHIPEFVYYHRLHDGQATEKQNRRQQDATLTIQAEGRLRQAIRNGQFDRFLSIIMLSFGKQRQTLAALESLQRTVRIPHEIIVFDNGSEAETVSFLRERIDGHFPNVKVVYHPVNLGPAAGRREALKLARGEWFLVFDNDEIAEPGWLEELLVRASIAPEVGAVCCKVIFPNRQLQFSGGFIRYLDAELIDLGLYDRDRDAEDLATAVFRDCDWCPIGATLFTVNPGPFLHEGYPNAFEDAGVSLALRRLGLRLLNSPASWVWHEHFLFQEQLEMKESYLRSRYDPRQMLNSIASFFMENGLIIHDEYVWRENGLFQLNREQLKQLLQQRRGMTA